MHLRTGGGENQPEAEPRIYTGRPRHQEDSQDMHGRRNATLLGLPGEILHLVVGYLPLHDLNRLRLVCVRLRDAVGWQDTLRWKKSGSRWQLPTASLTELRQHLVVKLAESFVTSMDRGKVERVMKVWARRLEEKAFLEASCQEDYTMALTQLIFARHKKLVNKKEKEFVMSLFPCGCH